VTIELHINSPGGDVWDGIAIYNALCNHPASVLSYVDGIAASAASFIAQAGGKVSIARNGTMMIHDAEGICIGNAADMTEMADLLDKASNNIADIYAQRCSTVLQWRKAMKATSWYVGQEAVDAGLADEAYEPDPGTDDAPAERRRKATNIQPVVIQRLPADTDVSGDIPTPDNVDANDDGAEGGEEGEATTTTTTTTTEPSEESNTDALAWWNPEVFRVAMATAADQHRLYGFDPEAFREIMRAASENCPAPPEVKLEETPLPIGPPILDGREFLTAIRRGLL
jgi:ClpP class serine protease